MFDLLPSAASLPSLEDSYFDDWGLREGCEWTMIAGDTTPKEALRVNETVVQNWDP